MACIVPQSTSTLRSRNLNGCYAYRSSTYSRHRCTAVLIHACARLAAEPEAAPHRPSYHRLYDVQTDSKNRISPRSRQAARPPRPAPPSRLALLGGRREAARRPGRAREAQLLAGRQQQLLPRYTADEPVQTAVKAAYSLAPMDCGQRDLDVVRSARWQHCNRY